MATDYVLRLIDQIALMLAEILQLRKLGRARGSARSNCQRLSAKGRSPIRLGEAFRAIMLAELLLQDAEIEEQAGKKREALISRAQARSLITHNLGQLSPEDQASYRAKLDSLARSDVSSKDR